MAKGGSKPGERRGGRRIGTPNRATAKRVNAIRDNGELTPLEFMLSALRDEGQPFSVRADMAKAAAPYCHAKLANIEVAGNKDSPVYCVQVPVQQMTIQEWLDASAAKKP